MVDKLALNHPSQKRLAPELAIQLLESKLNEVIDAVNTVNNIIEKSIFVNITNHEQAIGKLQESKHWHDLNGRLLHPELKGSSD